MASMAIRKSSDITDVNALGMYDFYLENANVDDYTVLISGDRGYSHYYRVELLFVGVEFIACAPKFEDMGTFQFRLATEQEATTIYENHLDYAAEVVYCFEEDPSRWSPMPERKGRKFFIAAHHVEVTIHYDAENSNHLQVLKNMKQE